ncbi:MAG: polyprenyl synthetase family protein [Clostridia bacterium]
MSINNLSFLKREVDIAVADWALRQSFFGDIGKAIFYALDGGKRLRPIMLLIANNVVGGNFDEALPFAVGIELIHNYSLVHDDMPCMDNDDLRRGIPTVHKKFGEWQALLTGDALLNGAYEYMLENANTEFKIKAMKIIASCAGIGGMIYGQYLDLNLKNLNEFDLDVVNKYKTGKLFTGSLEAGAVLANADNDTIAILKSFGDYFGQAFQIADDISDVLDGKDAKLLQYNYANVFGLEIAKRDLKQNIDNALLAIKPLQNNEPLIELLSTIKCC